MKCHGKCYDQYYVFLHFAEIEKLPPGHKRIINLTFDDENSLSGSQLLTLEYLKPVTLGSNFTKRFTIKAATDSDAPPMLNAIEICRVLQQPNSPAAEQDGNSFIIAFSSFVCFSCQYFFLKKRNNFDVVELFHLLLEIIYVVKAIMEIKRIYGISKISWQGDPCVPENFAWGCLNCSDDNNIRIISLLAIPQYCSFV